MNSLSQLLINSDSYKSFLAESIPLLKKEDPHWSYERFAKHCGFSSKSYVRAIFTGKKRMTANALPKFVKGFALTEELSDYFRNLVFLSEPDLIPGTDSESDLLDAIKNTRLRIEQRAQVEQVSLNPFQQNERFDYYYWPIIYAALGTEEKGVTFDRLRTVTGIKSNLLQKNLDMMLEKRIVTECQSTGNFKPGNFHLLFEHVKEDTAVQGFFLRSMMRASQAVKFGYSDKNKVFYSAAFSIQSKDREHFNNALMNAIYQVLEKYENPEGDYIQEVSLSSFPWDTGKTDHLH